MKCTTYCSLLTDRKGETTMKHKILFTLQLGLVLALLFAPKAFLEQNEATDSQAGSSVNAGVSVADIYNKMIAQFTIGERTDDFDGAMETYQLYSSLPLQPYSDAEEYYRYMQAREFLVQEKFSDAEILFRSLDPKCICIFGRIRAEQVFVSLFDSSD